MNSNEPKNNIERIKACSNSMLRWFNRSQDDQSIRVVDCEFKSSRGSNYVKFICLQAYSSDANNYKYAIKLYDKKNNIYFLFIGVEKKGDQNTELKVDLSKIFPIYIPSFEIKEGNIFFHVGDDGVKTDKKNVYQDIYSYLESNSFLTNNQTENIIQDEFNFLLAREIIENETKTYEQNFIGTCRNPTLEQVKKSIVKQFTQSYCFEKLIFSCQQERKKNIFTNFFVIIDQNFLTDTFNYWQDKSKSVGIETDYKTLVKSDGIPFYDAQQFLMDPNYTVESFIQTLADDQDQVDGETNKKSNLFLNYFNKYLNEDQEKIIFSVFCLYGLLHAKYILTPPGQAKMLELYVYNSFPKCPRSKCNGIRCLPYGITEKPACQKVKMYCPKCKTIYNYIKNSLDGAFFGPTYVHLLIRKFPKLKEFDQCENDEEQNKFSMFGIPLMSKDDEKKMKEKQNDDPIEKSS